VTAISRSTQVSATELAAALERGETTSVEITKAHLDNIEKLDGQVHAFLHVDAEGALAQAEASDARRAAGRTLSALDGVPIAVKDVLTTEGLPGSPEAPAAAPPPPWRRSRHHSRSAPTPAARSASRAP
jgi:Asp-tRNA(Asn)/Glu-tRNA(Gln) amidotransferase A subunit family amidase